MMKTVGTQFKKWGFLKQIKTAHMALGVIVLGCLTMMLFFQNCSDSRNIAELSPNLDNNLMSVAMSSVSSLDHLDLFSDLENKLLVDLGFCNFYNENDPNLCTGSNKTKCESITCNAGYIETSSQFTALNYFCFPPPNDVNNENIINTLKTMRTGDRCSSNGGYWIATQELTDNSYYWDCKPSEPVSCIFKRHQFAVGLGFCRLNDSQGNTCTDESSCTSTCNSSWVDTASEIRELGYFCLPLSPFTDNSSGAYEGARNSTTCSSITNAIWTRMRNAGRSWICVTQTLEGNLSSGSCHLKEGFVFNLGFCRLNDSQGNVCTDESSCTSTCNSSWVDTPDELDALGYFCLPPNLSSSNIGKPAYEKFRNGGTCQSNGGQWTKVRDHYRWSCDDNGYCQLKKGFHVKLGFCRLEGIANCEDQKNISGQEWKWVDTEDELKALGYFCIPSDLSTSNTNRAYENARNSSTCSAISSAKWIKIRDTYTWSCDDNGLCHLESKNQAPIANNPIRDHIKSVGDGPITGYLPGHFSDPDGDSLSFTASSSATSVATVGIASNGVITVTIVGAGTATISITATDPGGLSVTDDFTVTVQ